MKKRKKQQLVIVLMVLLLAACGGASSDQIDAVSGDPQPGEWSASADFGEFVFIVNAEGKGITKITYKFSDWTCGPVTMSGDIGIGQETGWEGWPITGGQFSIEKTLDPGGNQEIVVEGTFDQNGNDASGTWSADFHGTTCSGTWEASSKQ